MTNFLLDYIHKNSFGWKTRPRIYSGEEFQQCIVLVFGKPRTAVFAHIDSIGFTVRYNNQLVRIGSPQAANGVLLTGFREEQRFEFPMVIKGENELFLEAPLQIEAGTDLTFKQFWNEDKASVQSCYLDNRLGVWNALRLCETLRDGAVVFSCWEEHGGGSVPFLARFLYETFRIRQALISDITWVTEGVRPGKGVVVSLRDTGIPRREYVNRILELARKSGIPFQREVEGSGGSDGTELQKQPYPIDWCFVGAPEEFVHSPKEKVAKADIDSMLALYRYLLENL
jgi:putative aminopeptidase FrvX